MVTFTVDNIFTHIDRPEYLSQALDKYLVIRKDGFVKGIDFKEYRETGRTVIKTKYHQETINLYNCQKQVFPTGRLGYLVDWMYEQNMPWKIVDNRQKPERRYLMEYVGPPADGSNGQPARPYQVRAPQVLRAHGGRGIFWHATASGKTNTAARIIADLGVNTLYLVPSIELLDQTADGLTRSLDIKNGRVGVIGEGRWDPQAVTVATTQTLWARFDRPECKNLLNSTELLIGDEIHHVSGKDRGKSTKGPRGEVHQVNSWYILGVNCPAYYRVGLTGTPGKDLDQKRCFIEMVFGRVIDRVSARELIDAGVISDVEIHMHDIVHSRSYSDFYTARREGVLLNDKFNEYIVNVALAELKMGRSVLLLTESKAHQGPALERMFRNLGVDVPFVSGDSTSKERKRAREDFKAGTQRALIGTIYREGVDFPALDSGILCAGGLDEKVPIQFLGRVLRKAKGKGMAHLHDFNHKKDKFLQKHSRARLQYFLDEELTNIISHKGITV